MTLKPCLHEWDEVETYCEDCGTHQALWCEHCETLVDLTADDDPREEFEVHPYRCTWSQTGYQYGVYVNNGQNCEQDGTPLRIDGSCPACEASK